MYGLDGLLFLTKRANAGEGKDLGKNVMFGWECVELEVLRSSSMSPRLSGKVAKTREVLGVREIDMGINRMSEVAYVRV